MTFWMQTSGASLLAVNRCSPVRVSMPAHDSRSAHRLLYLAAVQHDGHHLTGPQVRIRVAPKAGKRLKDQLRILTRRSWRVSMEYRIGRLNRLTTGWMAHFRFADSGTTFRDLDGWLRRRLRQVRWKEWKTTAAKRHNLRIRGISESNAANGPVAARGTGGLRPPRSFKCPCPTPTGTTSA